MNRRTGRKGSRPLPRDGGEGEHELAQAKAERKNSCVKRKSEKTTLARAASPCHGRECCQPLGLTRSAACECARSRTAFGRLWTRGTSTCGRIPVYQDPADLLRHLDEVGARGVAMIHLATNTVSSQAETGAADLSHCSIWSCPTKPACWITGRPPARTAK